MKVFKFGGASLKDADSVRNVASVLKNFSGEQIIVVVSAMGKITNSLEKLADAYFYKKSQAKSILQEIEKYHLESVSNLFMDRSHAVYKELAAIFKGMEQNLNKAPSDSYNKEYDQIVSMGEIISSRIVSDYLNEAGVVNNWLDIRNVIKTDKTYREGKVDWEQTESLSRGLADGIRLTQGFLGRTEDGFTTTLGREGSDYTAAILAYCTNAESVTIWKDVPGVMNADPKWFDETKLIEQMSYHCLLYTSDAADE